MSNSPEYAGRPPATSRTRLALLALWAALTVAALGFVFTLGSNCPNADEWDFVPALFNREPLGPWLWAQHNEHRLPLPRLVYYTLFQFTHDFRGGAVLQVILLSGTSLGLMSLAARFRGEPHWVDAFFPVSLIHAGHWENLLIGYNLCFAFILVLETMIGVIALRTTRETAFRSGCRAGVLMMLLCLCGGGGVVTAMPVAAWLVYLAILVRKQNQFHSAVLLLLAAFPAVYLAVYLQGYQRPGHHPEVGEGGADVLVVAARVMSLAFGPSGSHGWAWLFAAVAALIAITTAAIVRSAGNRPSGFGLLAILAGIVGVAIVIGLGRAGIDSRYGLSSRYGYLVWPLISLTALFWIQRGGRLGKWIPAALCIVAVIRFNFNMVDGLGKGSAIKHRLDVVQVEAAEGVPPEAIVRHFKDTFQAHQEERAIRAIPMLRRAEIGMFGEARR